MVINKEDKIKSFSINLDNSPLIDILKESKGRFDLGLNEIPYKLYFEIEYESGEKMEMGGMLTDLWIKDKI